MSVYDSNERKLMSRPHDLRHGMRGAHAPAAATSLRARRLCRDARFGGQLRATGHRVHYLTIDDPDNLDALLVRFSIRAFEYQAPDEWRLDAQLADCGRRQTIPWPMPACFGNSGARCHGIAAKRLSPRPSVSSQTPQPVTPYGVGSRRSATGHERKCSEGSSTVRWSALTVIGDVAANGRDLPVIRRSPVGWHYPPLRCSARGGSLIAEESCSAAVGS